MIKTHLGSQFSRINLVAYIATLIICFLFYCHTDALYTSSQSLIFVSHFKDFYTYNNLNLGLVPYFPTIYSIIYMWNFPLIHIGLIDPGAIYSWTTNFPVTRMPNSEYFIFLTWYKFLILSVTYLSSILLRKISDIAHGNKNDSQLLFLTSPFLIFLVLIFSGYDIFSVFFTLVGIYFLLKNKKIVFSLFFSIAITFKFFPALLFLPLLLLVEKNLIRIFMFGIMASLISLLTFLIYRHDQAFLQNVFFLVKEKASLGMGGAKNFSFFLFYFSVCLYAFFSKNYKSLARTVLIISYLIYSSIFLFFNVNPQWVLLLLPFSILLSGFNKRKNIFFAVEVLGFFSFMIICIHRWMYNIDQKMLFHGPLSFIFSKPFFPMGNFYNFYEYKALFVFIFYFYIFYPLIQLFQKNRATSLVNIKYIYMRYLVIYFFIVVSFLCLLPISAYMFKVSDALYDPFSKSIKCIYNVCN